MVQKQITLSHSGLSILDTCPRCFWLKYTEKINWPEGFVSRLANRFDGIIKKYFDRYREEGALPSFLAGKVQGKLESPFQERYTINHSEKYRFFGKLDECLITPDGRYTPIDHKTSSSDPRTKDPHPAYQLQLDAYAWLLEAHGKPTSGKGILIFYYPDITEQIENGFPFVMHVVELDTHPESAKTRFLNGIEVLASQCPAPGSECQFCKWLETVKGLNLKP